MAETKTLQRAINEAIGFFLRDNNLSSVPRHARHEGYTPTKTFPYLLTIQGPTNLTRGWVRLYDPATDRAFCAPFIGRAAVRVGLPYPVT